MALGSASESLNSDSPGLPEEGSRPYRRCLNIMSLPREVPPAGTYPLAVDENLVTSGTNGARSSTEHRPDPAPCLVISRCLGGQPREHSAPFPGHF